MRRIFIGDIQGCAEELKRLLAAVAFEPGSDRLYSVGVVVNRGPESAEAVRVLRAAGAIAVVGNHEKHWLDAPATELPKDMAEAPDRDELMAWLRALPALHEEPDLILVHAGYSPAWQHEPPERVAERLNELQRRGVTLDDDAELRFAVTARYCTAAGLLLKDWL
jgi:bis(5'-nucleosyl)-tetraphosphatase (symmetrical)